MRLFLVTLLGGATLTGPFALAQTSPSVQPLPGYACMTLNVSDAQARDFKFHVPFYSTPDASSQLVGYAGSQVAVRYPTHEVNGFVEAIFPTGADVWIGANYVRPYHSTLDPTAKCIPVIMANGKQGFAYPH